MALGGIVLNMIIISQHIGFLLDMPFSEFYFIFQDFATMIRTMPVNASDKGQVA